MKNNSKTNKKFKNYYTYYNTSEAHDYDKIYYKQVKKTKKSLKRVKYKYSKNKKEGISFSTCVVLFTFFISSIFILLSYSTVTMERKNNTLLQKKLNFMQNKTCQLSEDLLESINLSEIEHIAKTKLDMKEPESYQIVYVEVPKKNYVVYVSTNENLDNSLKEKYNKFINNINKIFMRVDNNAKKFD